MAWPPSTCRPVFEGADVVTINHIMWQRFQIFSIPIEEKFWAIDFLKSFNLSFGPFFLFICL